MSLAELSLKRPVSAIMLFVSLTVIGLIAATRLPLEYFPDIEVPFLFIDVPYPGSTPAEIEHSLTRPIEEAMSTLPGLKDMQSTSRADGVQLFLQFQWGQDVSGKAIEARDKIDAIRADLPSDLQRVFVQKFSTSDQPVLQLRIASDRDLSGSWDLIERKLKRPLERVPGVARVEIQGVAPPEVQIELIADQLNAHGIDLDDLAERLREANFTTSAGRVDEAGLRYQVQPQGEWRSLEDIRAFPINADGLRLRDIAEVSLEPARLDYERRLDMRPAVAVNIYRERSANLVAVGGAVLAEVARASTAPEMQGLQLYFLQNQAEGVTDSLHELGKAGLIGIVLSVFVLFFFLRDWPSTLMVSLAIPLSLVMTLGGMHFFGISLNVLSMMGLLLAVGMLVDNAVVVVESIYQYRERHPDRPWYAAIEGTRMVGTAITAGTLTSIIVFLPNIFGERNPISIYLTQVAVSMAIAHLASWLVAVSLIPMLSARLPPPRFLRGDNAVSRLRDRYARLIGWTLCHRGWTMLGVFALLLVSVIPIGATKKDMFPSGETRELYLQYDLNGSYRLDELRRSIGAAEQWLLDHKRELEISKVYTYYDEKGEAMTNVLLTDDADATRDASAIMEDIREGMPKLAIGEVMFDNQSSGATGDGLKLSLVGDSAITLGDSAPAVIQVLRGLPALRDVRLVEPAADREVAVHVDRERAARFGFSADDVAQYVAIALRGAPLREYRHGDMQIPVWLRFRDADTRGLADLRDYRLRADDGTRIPLASMVDLDTRGAAASIRRDNRQTSLQIQANLAPGTTLEDARKAITDAMGSVSLPAGYRWTFGTSFRESDEAGQQMAFNTLIALLLVYIVMCAMFESLIYPAAIMTTFVFSIFGVFWLFWLTGTTFSIMASIGVLILMGVVVNNGIVMIVHINQVRHAGALRSEALIQGACDRLRPILMTMGTAILGMVPLCIGSAQLGGDGPPYFPMARAIVGGLLFSTLMTLVALPVIYALLDDARGWLRAVVRDTRAGRVRRRAREAWVSGASA